MKYIKLPDESSWLDIVSRPEEHYDEVDRIVDQVFARVAKEGDRALLSYTQQFDGIELDSIVCKTDLFRRDDIKDELVNAIDIAYDNIWRFHEAQKQEEAIVQTSPGVECWRRDVAIDRVGLYIPGGTAPLFSSILMLAIPARIAACREIVLCTPPSKDKTIHPLIAYTCQKVGIDSVCLVGGAQAIAAMSIGTDSVARVDKIFGPGNTFVTRAKMKAMHYGVAIDMPAGPSELLVIADSHSNPAWVASDLLSQAEHGPDSQLVLLSDSVELIEGVFLELERQLPGLPRRKTAAKALANSFAVLLDTLDTCLEFSNVYAPEHLIVVPPLTAQQLAKIRNAGSVFLGAFTCESAGDYVSGTNHTLPTNGFARNYSGVSYDSFVKRISFQQISAAGLRGIGPHIEVMASSEGLEAHRNAVSIRLKEMNNE